MPNPTPISEVLDPALRDEQAVAAVLGGDMVSYRELVERYERLVYAVAWSRLGDVTLAEDAAQEAFIRAYRSLPLLGNGAKFSAWVTAIARNTAYSLGLKHRKELEKRERWAVEQPEFEPPLASTDEKCPPELLRQTLAELTEIDRESLVLFYLEGKRGAEAAAALGISEAALRMRLMRARAALRERLEARLGESLTRLQPSHSMVPGVMGIIASTSTTKAGGAALGTTLLAGLGKVLPFGLSVLLVNLASAISASGLFWWIARLQRRNYREPEGFRAQIQRDISRHGMFWLWVQLGCLMSVIVILINWDLETTTLGMMGVALQPIFGIMGVGFLPVLIWAVRNFQINRRKDGIAHLVFALTVCGGSIAVGLGLLPPAWCELVAIGVCITGIPLICTAPSPRMDRSLFLREQMGVLKSPAASEPAAGVEERLTGTMMLAFARFLGERQLLSAYQWTDRRDGLLLRLQPVKTRPSFKMDIGIAYLPRWQWRHCSWIRLAKDGRVSAHCGQDDEPYLRQLAGATIVDFAETERRVATVATEAWKDFREGNSVLAANKLGEVPEAEIFQVPHERSIMTRAMKGGIIAAMIVMAVLAGFNFRWLSIYQYNDRGIAKFDQRDYDGAIADFTSALAFNAKFAAAYNNRGSAKGRKGDYAGAVADFTQAVALDPTNADTYWFRAWVKSKVNDNDGAIADYTKSLELNPQDATAYNNRGMVKKSKGDKAGALADYNQAIKVDAKNAIAYYNRGDFHSENGDNAAALADFDQYIKLAPLAPDGYQKRSEVRKALNDSAGADADAARAVALDPDIPAACKAKVVMKAASDAAAATPSQS